MDFNIMDFLSMLLQAIIDFFNRFTPKTITIKHRKFQIVKTLGEGGFGFVFLVKESTGNHFALKTVKVQLPEHETRLREEINAHRVIHQNVISLLDYELVKHDGRVVEGRLLLPFYKNGTVQDLIEKGPLDISQILKIGIDICNGLQAFHQNPPLAFRDLKPANLLINDSGGAVLMDLGSVSEARLKISSRREAVALAEHCAETVTAPYRAPELFDPSSDILITEASDIWALGCTLYSMAYGESPFDGSITATIGGKINFPANDKYGPHFRGLIQGILQPNNKQRPTLAQVKGMLEKMISAGTFESV